MQVYGMQRSNSGRPQKHLRRVNEDGDAKENEANGQKEKRVIMQPHLIELTFVNTSNYAYHLNSILLFKL